MRRILLALAFGILFTGLLSPAPADASPSAYTRLIRPVKGYNGGFTITCHDPSTGSQKWMSGWNTDSFNLCPTGWINGVVMPAAFKLHVLNQATLNETVYPLGYVGSVGGGTYTAWVTCPSC